MCRHVVRDDSDTGLCGSCWRDLTFLTDSSCITCGLPFEVTSETEQMCGACLANPPPFSRTKAAVLYDDASKDLVMKFKHGDATHLAPIFAAWLEYANTRSQYNLLSHTDLLIPVPLHWTRLMKRHFNQASLLGNALSKRTGISIAHDILNRTKATKSQGHLSRDDRLKNVSGKFSVSPKKQDIIKGKVITLIDDVYTSGATVTACAKTLKSAGAKEVYVLTLARVANL